MDASTFFNSLWPIVSAGLIVPLTQVIKSKIPADLPISSVFVVAVLNFISIWGLSHLFGLNIPIAEMVPYLTGGMVVSSATHAMVKSIKKNPISEVTNG
jgi:hypothetical protein